MTKRAIFRPAALAAYKRGTEKDNVPRLIFWPVIACLWVLLGMLVTAGFLAWNLRFPTYVEAPGMIVAATNVLQPASGETGAVVFLPPDQTEQVRVGQPVDLAISSTGIHLRANITKISPVTMSPQAARENYRLDGAATLLVKEPVVIVDVRPHTPLPATEFAGAIITARVETGSQRLLALLPGLGRLFGGHS